MSGLRHVFLAGAFAIAAQCAFATTASALMSSRSIVSSASPVPSVSLTTDGTVWQGVTLGERIDAVMMRMGQPSSRRKSIMGTYVLEYETLGGRTTLSLTDAGGIVTGIRLVAVDPSEAAKMVPPLVDPFGVALGDSQDRLSELRGLPQRYDDEGGGDFTSYYGKQSEARWLYGLHDGVVASIGVIAPYRVMRATGVVVSVPTPRPSNAPTPPPPDASAFDRAVKVTAGEIAADPQFEYTWVRHVACGTGDAFSPVGEAVVNAHRRNYRHIDAVCPSTGEKRSFYFDITDIFGRGDR